MTSIEFVLVGSESTTFMREKWTTVPRRGEQVRFDRLYTVINVIWSPDGSAKVVMKGSGRRG